MVAACFLVTFSSGVFTATFADYQLRGSFELPLLARVFDALPDGRIIALADDEVWVETAVGSRIFSLLGSLPGADIAVLGPAFLRVSPNGTQFAVGNNGGASFVDFEVGVFQFPDLGGAWFSAPHFDGAWYDETRLALTAGDFVNPSVVTVLDTTSANPLEPLNAMVIQNIGGASAGIAFDSQGSLFTGNGFQTSGPSGTGAIKAFANSSWLAAAMSTPLDFEKSGTLVVDLLSASSLGFDGKGDLFIGGGDFVAPDVDYSALVAESALGEALSGSGAVDAGNPDHVRKLDPDAESSANYYSVVKNLHTFELYLFDSSATTVYVYAPSASPVPVMPPYGMALLCLSMVVTAACLLRPTRRTMRGIVVSIAAVTLGVGKLTSTAIAADPWADEVISAHSALDGSGLYNDPQSVLGPPSTHFYDMLFQTQRVVSIIAPAVNRDSASGDKLITTLNAGQFIKVRFDEPVEDHPRNPFGIDLIVFGNSFFVGDGFALPDTDLDNFTLRAGLFSEPVRVAISPTGIGDPESHAEEWYVYDHGPFADSLYPTQAYDWIRSTREWGVLRDFTVPVDSQLELADFDGALASEAIELYECSAGGTGFDLKESRFQEIRFVYITATGGEVDALAAVFPSLGDFDRDRALNLMDFRAFQNCFGQSIGENGTCGCRPGDFDGSRQIDLADAAAMVAFLVNLI